jgi:hypothetical protein
MGRKILFLDVDGVLNSDRNIAAYNRWPWPGKDSEEELDPIAIGMIRRVCDLTGAEIIFSSTWRENVDAVEWGKKWNLPIVGATVTGSKHRAIKHWLANNHDVDLYAIIDDDEMYDTEHQVFTEIHNGMQWNHYNQLLDLLMDEDKLAQKYPTLIPV